MPITVERDLRRRWLVATATGAITIEAVLELLQTARASVELQMWPLLTPIRTVDAGGHLVGIGIVHRARSSGANMLGSASHDSVTEVYQVLEGSGTLVTGGTLTEPERRGGGAAQVVSIDGPGVSGKAIQGGVSRKITKGDMVIIPAGTPHWFSEIQQDIVYTVVSVDPARVVTLKSTRRGTS